MRLDLGCGPNVREGFTGVDAEKYEGVEHVVDLATADLPFETNSIDTVSSSHFLEHLTDQEAYHVLEEAFRVTEPGGRLELVVPNFPKLLECFLNSTFNDRWLWWIKTIYGNQHAPGEFHKSGWDTDKLYGLAELVGYREMTVEEIWTHDQPCLRLDGRKPYEKIIGSTS